MPIDTTGADFLLGKTTPTMPAYQPNPSNGPLSKIAATVGVSQPAQQPDPNAVLNGAQDQAYNDLLSSPLTDTAAAKAKANDMITTATQNISSLAGLYNNATTGPGSIAERTKAAYGSYGIDQPDFKALNDELAAATEEYKNTQVQKADNLTQRENQLAGGGTQDFANAVNNKDQRTIALQSLAAATRMQVAQQRINNATDIFKELSSQSETEQKDYISTISDQLNLNKADLSAGLDLMKQAISEEHGDATAAKSLIIGLAQNYPNFFDKLTPQDQQAISRGQITPSILATLGTLSTNKQTALDIAQQRADQAGTVVTEVGGNRLLIDKLTGAVISNLGPVRNTSNGSDVFTQTQLNKGAVTADLSMEDFSKLSTDEKNFYINNGTGIKNIKDEIDKGTIKRPDIETSINLPAPAKDQLVKYYLSKHPQKGGSKFNPLNWF